MESARAPSRSLVLLGATVSVVFTGSHSFLMSLCKDEHGNIPFVSTDVVLLIEASKSDPQSLLERVKRHAPPFVVPALCYSLNNNLAVFLQTQMDSATFQALANLKIFTTALIFKSMLRKRFSARKWAGIALLAVAGAVNALGNLAVSDEAASAGWRNKDVFVTPLGLLVMLGYCVNSGFAGVFSEKVIKGKFNESYFVQGIAMYGWGLLIMITAAAGPLFLDSLQPGQVPRRKPFLVGFTFTTWIIVLTQASNGLLMGMVLKFANNIMRLFIIGVSMVLATLLAIFGLHLQITLSFALGVVLTGAAIVLYYGDGPMAKAKPVSRV